MIHTEFVKEGDDTHRICKEGMSLAGFQSSEATPGQLLVTGGST